MCVCVVCVCVCVCAAQGDAELVDVPFDSQNNQLTGHQLTSFSCCLGSISVLGPHLVGFSQSNRTQYSLSSITAVKGLPLLQTNSILMVQQGDEVS